MIRILPVILLLAACGVEGAPVPPSEAEAEAAAQTGVSLSGSVEMGISRTF
ncbi:hypothetical protein SAMN05444004_102152 [Jannaschia faecimaris]|uniref:Argininosuccinate lyase n=1 Tax=Jannaschia faecimaris TaxID=1244108 RepID=A0A1H3LC96_9RHOB|nr:argininosuccinate lyase [Jannaschia faecimaris]SDY61916.1 hypothetical protein SAMN05444004_102152 [Jannaschia faecimaris]